MTVLFLHLQSKEALSNDEETGSIDSENDELNEGVFIVHQENLKVK